VSKVNLDDIRQALEAKRKELSSGASDREEILIEKAADELDRLQQQLNREVAIRNLDRSSKLLKAVEAALARFTGGTFGVCLHCEEPIPEKRLKAIPWAAYCVSCQEKLDRQRLRGEVEEARDRIDIAA
jgi:DnaK suppressor protein